MDEQNDIQSNNNSSQKSRILLLRTIINLVFLVVIGIVLFLLFESKSQINLLTNEKINLDSKNLNLTTRLASSSVEIKKLNLIISEKNNSIKQNDIKNCEDKEMLSGTWVDTNQNYIKIGVVDKSSGCIFSDDIRTRVQNIKGGVVAELLSSTDNINWQKTNYWHGENGDLYRFVNCTINSGSESTFGSALMLEISKDNGKVWTADYDGSWMAWNRTIGTNGVELKFCKFSLGTLNSVWTDAKCSDENEEL